VRNSFWKGTVNSSDAIAKMLNEERAKFPAISLEWYRPLTQTNSIKYSMSHPLVETTTVTFDLFQRIPTGVLIDDMLDSIEAYRQRVLDAMIPALDVK
jgi:hypothetical protein